MAEHGWTEGWDASRPDGFAEAMSMVPEIIATLHDRFRARDPTGVQTTAALCIVAAVAVAALAGGDEARFREGLTRWEAIAWDSFRAAQAKEAADATADPPQEDLPWE